MASEPTVVTLTDSNGNLSMAGSTNTLVMIRGMLETAIARVKKKTRSALRRAAPAIVPVSALLPNLAPPRGK